MSFSTQASIADVENILLKALPDDGVRQQVFVRLQKSVTLAKTLSPNAWGLTLLKDGFRLNGGLVEVMVLTGGYLRVNLNVPYGAEPYVEGYFIPSSYSSYYGEQCGFLAPATEYGKWANKIEAAHEAFVQKALLTPSNRPRRGSPHTKSHSKALAEYIAISVGDHSDPVVYTDEEQSYIEGLLTRGAINRYERDPHARQKCLEHFGSNCVCCGMNFESTYGTTGSAGVHVHHLVPIHLRGGEYQVNPLLDLVPLCPNCHAAIHSRNPPYLVNELKLMREQKMVVTTMENNRP
jgi:HNH endonuclease